LDSNRIVHCHGNLDFAHGRFFLPYPRKYFFLLNVELPCLHDNEVNKIEDILGVKLKERGHKNIDFLRWSSQSHNLT
jgi:hypothetical protein